MTYDDARTLDDVTFWRAAWRVVALVVLLLYALAIYRLVEIRHQRDVFGHVACIGALGSTYSNALCEQLKAEGWTP